MILITLNDETTEVPLTSVDMEKNAEGAARRLFESILDIAKVHGGEVRMNEDPDGSFNVIWEDGPAPQWAEAYAVSDGADAPEFVAEAHRDDTLNFKDLD